eukprot:TRINITY_DN1483_c0_g1_i2.p1 TRINITY_DN1483_c0_g1~~TRINITY_DN1483_c0_g1_i2.p1  ORF type:complete len:274 (+),score=94.37 TRINITY_DN1483_c0_g1_i2:149-970(+)
MEQHSVARLIGAPPGYIGHDEGGQLTETVRRKPYSVILFDEVEKAHPQIFNVLLQVLDDGRLTDGQGRTVDFSNTVIIMTSNLGSEILIESIDPAHVGPIPDSVRDIVMKKVKSHFRPEFLNRLDDIVIFSPLTQNNLREIVRLQVMSVANRLKDRDILLDPQTSALDLILQQSYDPIYGARPLKRYLEKHLVTHISRLLISGQVADHCRIVVSASNGQFTFDIQSTSAGGSTRSRSSSISGKNTSNLKGEKVNVKRERDDTDYMDTEHPQAK